MPDFLMPALGADTDEGMLAKWLIAPGSVVHRGDSVAEVETEKGTIEIESFQEGTVDTLLVAEGTTVRVGTPLARLSGAGAAAAGPVVTARAPAPAPVAPPLLPPPVPAIEHVRAAPSTRRLAVQLGVDITRLSGTGPGGRISAEDVERAAATPPRAVSGMREAIARAMARSKREIPHYYVATHIDMSAALAWLANTNLERPIAERLLPAALLLKATALALREVPELNGFFVDGAFRPGAGIHVGVAISMRGGGLVAPAIHDADTLTLTALMAALHDLVARARGGHLRSSEISDPTITVTNLGDQGVEMVFGIIHPPQVALVGFGRIVERPWAVDGMIGVRPIIEATLSADHRTSDGHRGAVFLAALERRLREPETL